MAGTVNVVVSVDEGRLDEFPKLVDAMRRAGLQVTTEMAAVGTVAGSANENVLPRLEAINGVAHVERSRNYRVSPPYRKVQ